MQQVKALQNLFLLVVMTAVLSSCGVSVTKTITGRQDNSYLNESFKPLERTDYDVLTQTTGEARAGQLYLLFFPIGKSRSGQELESNAYNNAIENCPGADAVILPRAEYKGFFIPLILLNYTSRKITVTGRAVKLKGAAEDKTAGN